MAGLATTFDFLRKSENPYVSNLLILAMEVPNPAVKERSAIELLRRNTLRGSKEVILHYLKLPDEVRQEVRRLHQELIPSMHHALTLGPAEYRDAALQVLRLTENFHHFSDLVGMLADATLEGTKIDFVAETIQALARRIYDGLHATHDLATGAGPAAVVGAGRTAALEACSKGLKNAQGLQRLDVVVTTMLELGLPDDSTVHDLLWHATGATKDVVANVMLTSRHPGVMQLICQSLPLQYPHPRAIVCVKERTDPEFIAHLLRWLPTRPSQHLLQNLRQIHEVAWLNGDNRNLQLVPPALQLSLLQFVDLLRMPADDRQAVHTWLLKHGSSQARKQVAESASRQEVELVKEVVRDSVNSDDEDVQAWACSQLRSLGVPDAMTILIDRLESPSAVIREAASKELASVFSVDQLMEVAPSFTDVAGKHAGKILLKIAPQAIGDFQQKLLHPIRQHRLNAIRVIQRLALQAELQETLLQLLDEGEPTIQREVLLALAEAPTSLAMAAIGRHLNDIHARVRETAAVAWQRGEFLRKALQTTDAETGDEPDRMGANSSADHEDSEEFPQPGSLTSLAFVVGAIDPFAVASNYLQHTQLRTSDFGMLGGVFAAIVFYFSYQIWRGQVADLLDTEPSSGDLLDDLAKAHQLTETEHKTLRALADQLHLEQPALVFLDPRLLRDAANSASRYAFTCTQLESRLFS